MRYPDDIGLVWASMARFLAGAAAELNGVAGSIICFPKLTNQPAFSTPWARRTVCDWYDTRSAASRERIRTVVGEYGVEVVVYISCLAQTVDLGFLRGLGLRTISVEVDSYPANARQSWFKWAAKRILRGWLGMHVHDGYVANAHHQRRYLVDHGGLPPGRVVTVVNGVDIKQFAPGPRPDPASLGLPETDYYVVSISQARPEKRIDRLIDAAAELFRQRADLPAKFVHLGGGQCLEEWKARAEKLGLASRFLFPGGRGDVLPFLQLATVFAHTAERESFGFAVVEAMACGKPVVATWSPGPGEIVEQGITGRLVEPDDARGLAQALLALLEDPGERERLGKAARERAVRHYNARQQAIELARVIRRHLGNSR